MIALGKIGYLNVLPIYHPLETGILPNDFRIVSGPPARLNVLMNKGELDISAASSVEYARHPKKYHLLPNIAIGSRGPVQSVLLLSRVPVRELAGQTILVSAQTHTSAALLRVLMKQWNISVEYRTGDATRTLADGRCPAAILCIGDEALNLRHHADYPVRVDLGEAWRDQTGLPFIFGVWIVQRTAVATNPHKAIEGCATMLRAKQWGQDHIDELCVLAAQSSMLNNAQMCSYFDGLVYDLGPEQQEGLKLFYRYLYECDEIPAVPELDFLQIQDRVPA